MFNASSRTLNFFLIFLSFLGFFSNFSQTVKVQENSSQPWMTIFVHGIIKVPWTPDDFYAIIHNKVSNSRYAFAAKYIRENSLYSLIQPIQEIGLKPVNMQNSCANASKAIASVFEQQYGAGKNLYYTFGWVGLLSNLHREQEAFNLTQAIELELNRLKELNINPKIRIIGFSHGGNVILNMAKYVSKHNLPFTVNELVLVGTPIQSETDYLANSCLFEKIYNLYSDGDIAQTADFLTTKYGSSRRKFTNRHDFKVPDKILQLKIRTTKKGYLSKDNKLCRLTYSDPTHMELWSFGWAKKIYRQNFPLYPLPAIAFVPIIIENVHKGIIQNKLKGKDITVTIIPKYELIQFKDNCQKQHYAINFPHCHFSLLKNSANQYNIVYSYCEHNKLMKCALNYAYQEAAKCLHI